MSQDNLGLFDTPPDRTEIRFALTIGVLLFATLILILPVRDVRLPEINAFVPVINAIMLVGELITATLLYSQAVVFRSRALAVLATGFVFSALLLVPHGLTFPGAFSPEGLLGAGVNTTGWIANFRRLAVPVAIMLYVHLKRADQMTELGIERPIPNIGVQVIVTMALTAALTMLATIGHDLLPPFFIDRSELIYSHAVGLQSAMFAVFAVAAAMLFRTRNSVLDMWLLVALAGLLAESLLTLSLRGRFTAGWYCLFTMTVFSHLVVMLALIAESNRLYARLVLSTAARERERDARLMSMDVVAAAISHEVGQPLAAVTTNAMAGLNWLSRPKPNVDMAIKAQQATIEAGQRTFDVIKSIRAMFAKGSDTSAKYSLNDLVRETATLLDRELASTKVSLQLALDETLPPIQADRVQMQRVLINLFSNAMESLATTRGRPRQIVVRTLPSDSKDVLLEISDNGVGISPVEIDQIFEAFVTTKATGTGLGLSLCRTIVAEHGGLLWATKGDEYGATFHLRLPCADR